MTNMIRVTKPRQSRTIRSRIRIIRTEQEDYASGDKKDLTIGSAQVPIDELEFTLPNMYLGTK